jgi:hypothetical protein
MKELAQRQIHCANRVAAGTSAKEIEAALALIKKLRSRLEADRQNKDAV